MKKAVGFVPPEHEQVWEAVVIDVAETDAGRIHVGRRHDLCRRGDGDGLLDIVVANTFDWSNGRPIFVDPFAGIQHSQVYRNLGGNRFADVSS
jgi:hypothetical protein